MCTTPLLGRILSFMVVIFALISNSSAASSTPLSSSYRVKVFAGGNIYWGEGVHRREIPFYCEHAIKAYDGNYYVTVLQEPQRVIKKIDVKTNKVHNITPYTDLLLGVSGGGTQIGLHPDKKSIYYSFNFVLYKLDLTNNVTTPILGSGRRNIPGNNAYVSSGSAFSVDIYTPTGLYITPSNDIYISDIAPFMRYYQASTKQITLFGQKTGANSNRHAAFNSNYYAGSIYSAFGVTVPDMTALENFPIPSNEGRYGMAMRNQNELYVSFALQQKIYKYDLATKTSTLWATGGQIELDFEGEKDVNDVLSYPRGMHFINNDEMLFCTPNFLNILNVSTKKMKRFAGNGKDILANVDALNSRFINPKIIANDENYGLLIYDSETLMSVKDGMTTMFNITLPSSLYVFGYSQGYVYFFKNQQIHRFSLSGSQIEAVVGIQGVSTATPDSPYSFPLNTSFSDCRGIDFSSDGVLYFTDSTRYSIRRINPLTNLVETVAGTGSNTFQKDGPVSSTNINPSFMFIEKSKNVPYFYDGVGSFRKIYNGKVVTVAGATVSTISKYLTSSANVDSKLYKLSPPKGFVVTEYEEIIALYDNYIRFINKNGITGIFSGTLTAPLSSNFTSSDPAEVSLYRTTSLVLDKGDIYISSQSYATSPPTSSASLIPPSPANIVKFECIEGNRSCFSSSYQCDGISEDDPNVCGGIANMKCKGLDICSCETGYQQFSNLCLPNCFGFASNDSRVCNYGNGTCISPDTCSCKGNYIGLTCSDTGTILNNGSILNNTNNINITRIENSTYNTENTTYNCTLQSNSTLCNNTTLSENNSTILVNSTTILNETTNFDNRTLFNTTLNNTMNNGTILNITNTNTCFNTTNDNTTMNSNNTVKNNTFFDNSTLNNTSNNTFLNSTISNNSTLNNTTNGMNSTNIFNQTITTNSSSLLNNTIQNNTSVDNQTVLHNSSTTVNSSDTVFQPNQTSNNQSFANQTHFDNESTAILPNSTSCYGIEWNDSRVCQGQGNCKSQNNCSCYQNDQFGYFSGFQCDHCSQSYFGANCKTYCTNDVCNDHGECNSVGECSCYKGDSTGFWNGTKCNKCLEGYFGEECATTIVGPLRFNNEGNSLIFKISSPISFTSNSVDCKKLLDLDQISKFGSNPSCFYSKKENNDFVIELDQDHSLEIGYLIYLNGNVFNKMSSVNNFHVFKIETAANPVPPVISISQKDNYGSCENVIIDASESFSLDRQHLTFDWQVVQSNLLIISNNNSSKLKISYSDLISGQHTFRLTVKSYLFGLMLSKDISFIKLNYATPIVEMDGVDSVITISTIDLPLYLKKKIQLPECVDPNSQIVVKWDLLEGNNIEYQIDSFNNLKISNLGNLSCNQYSFKVSTYFKGSEQQYSSTLVTVNLKVNPITVKLLTVESNVDSYSFETSVSDPDNEQIPYTTKWSFNNLTNSVDLMNYLLSSSFDDSKTITKEMVHGAFQFDIILTLSKNGRSSSDVLSIRFPQPTENVAPIISVVNTVPPSVNPYSEITVELFITSQSSTLKRDWKLNGMNIDSSMTNMQSLPSESNILILKTDSLAEQSINIITFTVTDEHGLTSTFTHTFSINRTPKSCVCQVSPSSGIAMITSFTFNCPSCQTAEKSYKFEYGFIDDYSGSSIALSRDDQFFQKLPVPYFGNELKLYVTVVDAITGAKASSFKYVTISTPSISSAVELKKYVQQWNQVMNLLPSGDIRRSVFNSATISRTSDRMKLQLALRRSICNGNGQIQSDGTCKCNNAYVSLNCRWNSDQYDAFSSISHSLIGDILSAEKMRFESGEKTSIQQLTNILYGLNSILQDLDSLSGYSIDSTFKVLNYSLLSVYQSNNMFSNFEDVYLKGISNSLYSYLSSSQNGNYWNILISLSRMIGPILLRSTSVGRPSLTFESKYHFNVLNKHYKSDFNNMKLQSEFVNVTFPSTISKHLILKSVKSIMEYSWFTIVKSSIMPIKNPDSTKFESASLVSHVTTLELNPSPSISKDTPLKFVYSFKLLEEAKEGSIYECVNPSYFETNCSIHIESTVAKCECSQLMSLAILQLIPKSATQIEDPGIDDIQNMSPFSLSDLFWILWAILILLAIIILCVILVAITVCICKKRQKIRKNVAAPPSQFIELGTV